MSRLTRTLATASLAGLALTGIATAAAAGVNPELNHEEYWEQGGLYSCSKVEYADGLHHVTVPSDAAFIVVKAGNTVSDPIENTGSGTVEYHSDKDISWIITCYGDDGGYGS